MSFLALFELLLDETLLFAELLQLLLLFLLAAIPRRLPTENATRFLGFLNFRGIIFFAAFVVVLCFLFTAKLAGLFLVVVVIILDLIYCLCADSRSQQRPVAT